jgi:hypothetical protein
LKKSINSLNVRTISDDTKAGNIGDHAANGGDQKHDLKQHDRVPGVTALLLSRDCGGKKKAAFSMRIRSFRSDKLV